MILVRYRESEWHNWVRSCFQDDEYEAAQEFFRSLQSDWSDSRIVLQIDVEDEVILAECRETEEEFPNGYR